MAKTVHARLDDQSEAALRRLRRDTGLGDQATALKVDGAIAKFEQFV